MYEKYEKTISGNKQKADRLKMMYVHPKAQRAPFISNSYVIKCFGGN